MFSYIKDLELTFSKQTLKCNGFRPLNLEPGHFCGQLKDWILRKIKFRHNPEFELRAIAVISRLKCPVIMTICHNGGPIKIL